MSMLQIPVCPSLDQCPSRQKGLCRLRATPIQCRGKSSRQVLCRAGKLGAEVGGASVYVATIPLVGMEVFADLLGPRYPKQISPHSLVIIQQREEVSATDSSKEGSTICTAYDFLPVDPTSMQTAMRLLSGEGIFFKPIFTSYRDAG